MSQEAITEIDMDVFSRRIGPYFSWLESKIEGGWEQSESATKDVLKEVKYLSTQMRARFILGVTKEDFSKEVKRTLELLETAADAFPAESDEIQTKTKHFCKGIAEELGTQFLPSGYAEPRPPEPPDPHPVPEPEPLPEPEPEPKPVPQPTEEKIKKAKVQVKKPKIKKTVAEAEKPVVQKPAASPVKKSRSKKSSRVKSSKKQKKSFFLVRWAKSAIYGED